MFNQSEAHAGDRVTLGVAAALVVGWRRGGAGRLAGRHRRPQQSRAPASRPPATADVGPPMKGLTYAEFHVQSKDGQAEMIRLDQGKIGRSARTRSRSPRTTAAK